MATIGGGPPIPATTLSDSNLAHVTIAVVFQFFSTIAVILRFLCRRLSPSAGWDLSWDDWATLTALIFTYCNTISVILCATIGRAGYHLSQYTEPQLTLYLKTVLAEVMTLVSSVSWSKFALLLFFGRLFPVKSLKPQLWTLAGLTMAYWLGVMFCLIFSTHPIVAQFKPWLPHSGLNTIRVYEALTVIGLLIDVGILCVPLPPVWKLHIPLKRKILLSILFLLGFFACITNVVRLIYILRINPLDFTYSLAYPGIWGTIEVHLSIICGCMPMLPGLLRHWRERSGNSLLLNKTTSQTTMATTAVVAAESKLTLSQSDRTSSRDMTSEKTKPTANVKEYPLLEDEDGLGGDIEWVNGAKHAVYVQTDVEIQNVERTSGDLDDHINSMSRW